MVDIISTWISLFFPFINWFIPKRYVKISKEDFENLNIVKPAKKNVLASCRYLYFIRSYIKKVYAFT